MQDEKLAWLESHLRKAGYGPLLKGNASKFEDKAYLHVQYAELQSKPAFKDFLHRLTQTRDGFIENLVRGSGLDNWGNKHDDEIRAVIHCLNVILNYIPSIEEDFKKAEVNLKKMNKGKAIPQPGGITAANWDYW